MGISVITPLPFGGGEGGGAAIFLAFVCSVHLCSSVRKRTHPHKKEYAHSVRETVFICEKQASPRADPSDWMRVVEGTFRCEKSM